MRNLLISRFFYEMKNGQGKSVEKQVKNGKFGM